MMIFSNSNAGGRMGNSIRGLRNDGEPFEIQYGYTEPFVKSILRLLITNWLTKPSQARAFVMAALDEEFTEIKSAEHLKVITTSRGCLDPNADLRSLELGVSLKIPMACGVLPLLSNRCVLDIINLAFGIDCDIGSSIHNPWSGILTNGGSTMTTLNGHRAVMVCATVTILDDILLDTLRLFARRKTRIPRFPHHTLEI